LHLCDGNKEQSRVQIDNQSFHHDVRSLMKKDIKVAYGLNERVLLAQLNRVVLYGPGETFSVSQR